MNIPLVTAMLLTLGALPFTAGVLLTTWRQRRAMARRSRDLTIEIGPKVLMGLALSGVGVTPAMAATSPTSSSAAPAWLPVLDRGPVLTVAPVLQSPSAQPAATPTRHAAEEPLRHRRAAETAANTSRSHVVRAGESLWSITAHYLGPNAKISDIATAWPRLFELNRTIIGSNPRLVLPGQRLELPANFSRTSS
jgi:nucleoid-associated protein YgaU